MTQTSVVPSQNSSSKSIWDMYTYGSKQVRDDGANGVGAGFHNATRDIAHSINPRGSGATNTITRAELAAIAYDLLLMGQEQDEIIATVSQASFCMTAN